MKASDLSEQIICHDLDYFLKVFPKKDKEAMAKIIELSIKDYGEKLFGEIMGQLIFDVDEGIVLKDNAEINY